MPILMWINVKYAVKVLKIINQKNGQFISGLYITRESPIKIRCEEGHEWETKMGKIVTGSWCHECGKRRNKRKNFKNIKTIT